MAYQQNVISEFQRAARDEKASPKVRKALFEAGIVESHLQNLPYGDRDSLGPLQERTSIYGAKHARNPYATAVRFIRQAQPIAHKYGTAGQLAQAVQRSAFPARYDQQGAQASAVLKGLPQANYRGGGPPPRPVAPATTGTDARTQIALSLIGMGGLAGGSYGGDSLTNTLLQAAQSRSAPKPARGPSVGPTTGPAPAYGGGVAKFDGKPVAAWIAPILKQARATGLWKGSVTSGVRSKAEQLAAAKRFGLQHYPNGPLASNHVAGHGGAVDVSDPQGLKRALAAIHVNRLKSAMADDPVHFSRTGY